MDLKSRILNGLIAFVFGVSFADIMAAGGQNQWNNPIFADGCVAELPAGIDLEDCDEAAASPTGLKTYFCEGEIITVTCPDDGPQAPGQNR